MAEVAMQRWERTTRAGGNSVAAGKGSPERTLFGSILQPEQAQGAARGSLTRATLLAVGLHGIALLGLGVLASRSVVETATLGRGGASEEVSVTFMVPRAAPPAAAAPAVREQPTSRPVTARRRKPLTPPVVQPPPVVEPPPSVERAVVETEPVEEEGVEDVPESAVAQVASAEGAASGGSGAPGGLAGGVAGGSTEGQGGLMPPPPPPLPPALTLKQRQSLVSRYLQELFRSRIAARFQYPEEAELLGLEGIVMVRVSIDTSGQVLGMKVQGGCPHPVLCDAALRTVRESVPFPPPPAELGATVAVDVPFQYRLE